MKDDFYQFPAGPALYRAPWWQGVVLFCAVLRIGGALLFGDLQGAAAAVWWLKWESETLHRILAGQGADVALARSEVGS